MSTRVGLSGSLVPADGGAHHPALTTLSAGSSHVLLALGPLLVLVLGFDVYCLVNLFRRASARHLPRFVWAIVIVFVSPPLGGLLYLFLGRERNAVSEPAR